MTQAKQETSTVREWRYEIQYGPNGESGYAWVYVGSDMVGTVKVHHAIAICNAMEVAHRRYPALADTNGVLMDEVARLKVELRTVQNAAKTLAACQNTELQHLRQNAAFDHKLRGEHDSLLERDALMTEQVATLTARNAELAEALKPFVFGDSLVEQLLWADKPDTATGTFTINLGAIRAARHALEASHD